MEKKTRTIGILLLVLLVLLITFFGLKKWNTSKSEAEEKKKENAVVHIFETDSLESIEYKEASGEEMSFVVCAGHHDRTDGEQYAKYGRCIFGYSGGKRDQESG